MDILRGYDDTGDVDWKKWCVCVYIYIQTYYERSQEMVTWLDITGTYVGSVQDTSGHKLMGPRSTTGFWDPENFKAYPAW